MDLQRSQSSPMRVAVIGGGITGLTTCYRLQRVAHERNLPLQIILFEASDRLGGIIATSREGELLIEHGPDSFITTKPAGIELCEELELGEELIGTTTEHRRSFIVRNGKLRPVPQGLYLMVPGSLWSFATSSIMSWRGKLRAGLDWVLPSRPASGDESLAQFVTRRLGREALERLAQPMVGGIYTADPEQLSLQATMPNFLEMERRHGSLIRALRHNQRAAKSQGASGARYGLFVTFRNGMQTLVDRLAATLPADTVRMQTRVRGLSQVPGTSRWQVQLPEGADLDVDAVCLALPAALSSTLLQSINPDLSAELDIPYASSAIVNLAFRRQDVAHALDGMGFVVPAVEKRSLIACSFSSVKFAGRASDDQVLLRAFVGGALQHTQYERSDAEIQQAVCQDLQDLLGVRGDPLHVQVSRWPQSMAQYHLGHVERVARIESLVSHLPGLVLAGNGYHGVGIPDCIRSGNTAAAALLDHLSAVSIA